MKKCFCVVWTMLAVSFAGYAQKESVKLTDMLQIKTAGNVVLNPAGTSVVFSLQSIKPAGETEGDHEYVNQLWMADVNGQSAPFQLTGRPNDMQPAWSPDGTQLAFVRTGDNKKPQVFLLPMRGGEARQLTTFKYGATAPVWSPDGKEIMFTASVPFEDLVNDSVINPGKELPTWSIEKPGHTNEALYPLKAQPNPDGTMQEVQAYLQKNVKDKKARVVNKLNFQSETDVSTDLSFQHLFIVSLKAPEQPLQLTRGFFRFGNGSFFPDGKRIVFSGSPDSALHPDRVQESRIFMADTRGENVTTLLSQKGKAYLSPRLSPSGNYLAFLQTTTSFVGLPVLAVLDFKNNNAIKEIPFDRTKSGLVWRGEKQLYFTAQANGGVVLCMADVATAKVTEFTGRESGVTSFDIVRDQLVFTKTEVANPSELYKADPLVKQPVRISNFNADWVQKKQLSFPEKKSFVNEKGLTVEYWVMKPAGYQPGKKYPLLLEIHGGPSAMWGPGESSMWHEYQYFCSKGYGVVYSNPRGSGGYGEAFLRANVEDWGTGPAADVLTVTDSVISEGWVDTSRLLVTGGSYAGYLVSWIIAHDHRFKAACAQRGVYDLTTFLGEGNAWRLVPNYFGGYPWDEKAKAVIARESPINYVHNIQTPLIIFHGENDRRTGVIQSEMLYRSLKILNRPVEYVRHPGATHEITRSGDLRQRMDQMLRTWEFFERWIH